MHGVVAKLALQIGVQLGYLAQKGGLVITQRVFNLVGHREFGKTQQPGLPELHHAGPQLSFVGGQFARCQCVFGSAGRAYGANGQCQGFDVIACGQQLGDVALGVKYAFALYLGGVRRQNRRYKAVSQCFCDCFRRNTGPPQTGQGHFYAAFLGVSGTLVDGAAAYMVAVFCQIGQMAEIGEGAYHADGLVARQTLEQLFQRLVGVLVCIAAKRH